MFNQSTEALDSVHMTICNFAKKCQSEGEYELRVEVTDSLGIMEVCACMQSGLAVTI